MDKPCTGSGSVPVLAEGGAVSEASPEPSPVSHDATVGVVHPLTITVIAAELLERTRSVPFS